MRCYLLQVWSSTFSKATCVRIKTNLQEPTVNNRSSPSDYGIGERFYRVDKAILCLRPQSVCVYNKGQLLMQSMRIMWDWRIPRIVEQRTWSGYKWSTDHYCITRDLRWEQTSSTFHTHLHQVRWPIGNGSKCIGWPGHQGWWIIKARQRYCSAFLVIAASQAHRIRLRVAATLTSQLRVLAFHTFTRTITKRGRSQSKNAAFTVSK